MTGDRDVAQSESEEQTDEWSYESKWPIFCEQIKATYDESENPMYAWEVIGKWAHLRIVMEVDVALPEWCIQYLRTSSILLRELSRGVDVTKSRDFTRGSPPPTLEQNKRHALVSQALGLSRKAWSAFADYNSRALKYFDGIRYDKLRAEGFSSADALRVIDARAAPRDERGTRRRIAEGRMTKLRP